MYELQGQKTFGLSVNIKWTIFPTKCQGVINVWYYFFAICLTADLRSMHTDNEKQVPITSRSAYDPTPRLATNTDNQSSALEENQNFARGGHGIFGEGKVITISAINYRPSNILPKQLSQKKALPIHLFVCNQ